MLAIEPVVQDNNPYVLEVKIEQLGASSNANPVVLGLSVLTDRNPSLDM